MSKGKQYTQQFKEDAVRYKEEHPELTYEKAEYSGGNSITCPAFGNHPSV